MKLNHFKLLYFCLLVSLIITGTAHAQSELANPSFEEDAANVGNPDGWTVQKGAQATVVNGNASTGRRALLIEDGYVAIYQNLQIPQLANQRISLNVDAKSVSENAVFGARIGYYSEDNKWHDAPIFWNKPITANYQTYSGTRQLPVDAKGGRLYIGIYRSNKKSTFYIDNVKLQIGDALSESDAHRAAVLAREGNYFLNRLDNASKRNIAITQKDTWQKQAQQIVDEANAANDSLIGKFEEYEKTIRTLNTELFVAVANGKPLLAGCTPAFERLAPDALPPLKSTFTEDLISLRGEHQAFGIDVASGKKILQKIQIQVTGLPEYCNLTWRRQVFTETWYTKGKTVISDPLTKLANINKSTFINVQPGEMVRLFADIDVAKNAAAGTYPLKIELSENGQTLDERTINLQILSQNAPAQQMTNYAFGYINSFPISNHTADAVKDLVSHGVTDIEWAYMPPATFDKDGNLLKVNFSAYNKLLPYFAKTPIRLNVFWQPTYAKFITTDGSYLKVLSPEWKNALVQVLKAWIANANEYGIPAEQITILAKDEIHSHSLESSPDASIEEYVQIAKLLQDKIPGLKNYLTYGNYAFPNDIKKALPQVDVILPHMPLPEKLTRNAPPSYNPHQAFEQEVLPLLQEARDEHGLQISSYHVAAGRSDDLLQWNRFYPLLAAASGRTGIGYWAYNGFNGTTWDDSDGPRNLLDYNFIYDGTEKNPLCQQYNVTGETIVPSIRWEAVRAGLQDANIMLILKELRDTNKLTATQRVEFDALMANAKKHDGPQRDTTNDITITEMQELSRQLRKLYTDIK